MASTAPNLPDMGNMKLAIPSEHVRSLSKAVFDSNANHPDFHLKSSQMGPETLSRYEVKPLAKADWTFTPHLSIVDVKDEKPLLHVTGTVCVFDQDGLTKRHIELNLLADNSETAAFTVPDEPEPPFVVGDWNFVKGCDEDTQKQAVKILTHVASLLHGSKPSIGQSGRILTMWCQMIVRGLKDAQF